MHHTARQASGSRTAAAIDHAIGKVLEERRRAGDAEAAAEAAQAADDARRRIDEAWENGPHGARGRAFSARIRRLSARLARPITRLTSHARSTANWARDRSRFILGPPNTHERGFIMAAGSIVFVLTLLRMLGLTSPWFAIGVASIALAAGLAPALARGVAMERPFGRRHLQDRPLKSTVACALCAPAFTWLAGPHAFGRTTRASLWTSWLALLGGTVAVVGSIWF